MDKYMDSLWFIRIVSFALAALLFTSVSFEPTTGKSGTSTPGENGTEVIENVPVEVYYDQENLVVTGAPETVDVTLKGVKALLISAKSLRDFKVYIDLSDTEITMGEKQVPLKISGLNEKLSATIDPKNVTVTVEERVTKEFSVEVEYNQSLLANGYTAEVPVVNPETVKITGAKSEIEKISYVKATIELSDGANKTVNQEATVRALDQDLNKVDVTVEPKVVDVSLNVNISSKSVPIVPVQTGKLKNGIKIVSITSEDEEVTIYGKESVLSKIDKVSVPVDISDIEGDQEYELPITVPENVQSLSKEKVKVKVKTEKINIETDSKEESTDTEEKTTEVDKDVKENEENVEDVEPLVKTKTFSSLSVEPVNLPDNQELAFLSPVNGLTSIILKGNEVDLKDIDESSIQLFVDVAKLEEGNHELAIQVKVPSGITWELPEKNASISIEEINDEA